MPKKSKTVYNLENETVFIKIDAKNRDCVCKHEEKQTAAKANNNQQVFQQTPNTLAFKVPFHQGNQHVYPVSVTVEKQGKPLRSSGRSSGSSGSESYKHAAKQLLQDDRDAEYSISNEYDQTSNRNSSVSSKSTKSSSLSDRERIDTISEENQSFYGGEVNILATPLKGMNKTEVDLSVSNIEIAHYPFKYSERSPSMLARSSRENTAIPFLADGNALPFRTDSQSILMQVASITTEDAISSDHSESMLSVLDINNTPLPIQPRDHGQHCAIEVNVLEKHKNGCTNKKDIIGRNIEDKVGSYDVVSRVVYRTCGPNKKAIQSHIKTSLKSYHLDNPDFFGKNLQVSRSRVETVPILPNYKCILNTNFPKEEKTFGAVSGGKKPHIYIENEPKTKSEDIPMLQSFLPPEVLSVYIRTDKNEKVPDGFQKMHYRGDSCKLHDPEERTKQILQLQKVIEETSSEAYLSKSPRQFSTVPDAQVVPPTAVAAATAVADNPIPILAPVSPQITMPSDSEEETDDESITSLSEKIRYDNDSLDRLPLHKGNEEMVESNGLFNCFRRNKQKRQREATIEYVRDFSGKRVTHSSNQPKRHNEERPSGSTQRKLSAEYRR